MKKLLDMMADAPLDQLFQSAYIPQPNQEGKNAESGLIMPGMMLGSGNTATGQTQDDSSGLLSALSNGQVDSGLSNGGGWASLLGNSGLSSELASIAGLTGGEPMGVGPGGDQGGVVGPASTSPNAAANVVGTIASLARGDFIGSAMSLGRGAFNVEPSSIDTAIFNALSWIANQPNLAVQQGGYEAAIAGLTEGILGGMPTGTSGWGSIGGYGLAPAGYGLGDPYGGGYDAPGGAPGGEGGYGSAGSGEGGPTAW